MPWFFVFWEPGAVFLRLGDVDTVVAHWFRARLNPTFAGVLFGLSSPGSEVCVAALVVILALILLWKRRWMACAALLVTVPIGTLLGEMLKLMVRRQRPFIGGPFGEWGGYSFPSGHTLSATLLYGFLLILLVPMIDVRRWRFAVLAAGASLILGVAFSRVALGAHYLTDVTAAMLLGAAWVFVVWLSFARIRSRRALVPIKTHI